MSEIDTKAMRKALKPSRTTSPWFMTVVIGVCITLLSLIANLSLYQWGSDKSDQVKSLSAASECRSKVAADTDVAQGRFLADLGLVNLSTARALAALGQNDDSGVDQLVLELIANSNALDGTLALYRTQTQARARTAETCDTKK